MRRGAVELDIFSSAWCAHDRLQITSTLPSRSVQHRVAIGGLAQRRVHLHVGVVLHRRPERFVGQGEMVRGDLRGDADPPRLALADRAQRLPRAHMRDVDVRAGQLRQRDVPLDHQGLGGAGDPAQAERRGMEAFVRDAVSLERRVFAVMMIGSLSTTHTRAHDASQRGRKGVASSLRRRSRRCLLSELALCRRATRATPPDRVGLGPARFRGLFEHDWVMPA